MKYLQEELQEKTLAISIKAAKLTGRVLAKAIRMVLREMKKAQEAPKHGKQKYKELVRQDAGVSTMPIGNSVQSFDRVARKYKIDYAITRTNGRYLVFFKGRDTDAITEAFTEYSRKILRREKRPSVLAQLRNFKEQSRDTPIPDRQKQRERSGPEL